MENNRVLDKVKFLSESRGEESLNYFKFRKLLPFKHNDTCFTSHSKRLDRSQKLVAMIINVDFGYLSLFFYEILWMKKKGQIIKLKNLPRVHWKPF